VIRRIVFRPAAVRDLARLDRVVQARIEKDRRHKTTAGATWHLT